MPRKTKFTVDIVVKTAFDIVRKSGWEKTIIPDKER